MEASRLSAVEVRRYLEALGIGRERPSLTALRDHKVFAGAVERELGIPAAIGREAIAGIGALADLYERPAPHCGECGTSWGKPE